MGYVHDSRCGHGVSRWLCAHVGRISRSFTHLKVVLPKDTRGVLAAALEACRYSLNQSDRSVFPVFRL